MKDWIFVQCCVITAITILATDCSITHAWAQRSSALAVESFTPAQIDREITQVVSKAVQNDAGIGTSTLEKASGTSVVLSVRVKDGRAELHDTNDDYLFILDGKGTMMTGGTIINATVIAPHETRGTTLKDGIATELYKGVILHIPAGLPHQTRVSPGEKLVYYVIKVEEPQTTISKDRR